MSKDDILACTYLAGISTSFGVKVSLTEHEGSEVAGTTWLVRRGTEVLSRYELEGSWTEVANLRH